jgi:dihydropteroate synthase
MGILNVTPDSFSDGGKYILGEAAFNQAVKMIGDGADIIDVGGESTRPGARMVSAEEEIERIVPVIRKIKENFDVLVSVDTYKSQVAVAAVQDGHGDIINDISGLGYDAEMAETAAGLNVPVILMHIKGTPENMQKNPHYENVMKEISDYFSDRIRMAAQAGIPLKKIMIDPGIGFGKRFEDNHVIIQRLKELGCFGVPIVIGNSRKSFLGDISGEPVPARRDAETITADVVSILNGASIVRVHHVKNAVNAIRVLKKLVH